MTENHFALCASTKWQYPRCRKRLLVALQTNTRDAFWISKFHFFGTWVSSVSCHAHLRSEWILVRRTRSNHLCWKSGTSKGKSKISGLNKWIFLQQSGLGGQITLLCLESTTAIWKHRGCMGEHIQTCQTHSKICSEACFLSELSLLPWDCSSHVQGLDHSSKGGGCHGPKVLLRFKSCQLQKQYKRKSVLGVWARGRQTPGFAWWLYIPENREIKKNEI